MIAQRPKKAPGCQLAKWEVHEVSEQYWVKNELIIIASIKSQLPQLQQGVSPVDAPPANGSALPNTEYMHDIQVKGCKADLAGSY